MIVVLRLSWSRGCFKPITAWMDSLRYWTRSEEDHSGVLFGPRRNSPGMEIGWEPPPRMRSRTLTDLPCTLPSAWLPAWKVEMEELDYFYLDVTRMPCQHLKVCCVQGLSAMLKNTFTIADWLSVPAWLTVTVDGLSWCHSVLASELGKYVF